jgi:predicted PurR-regulated permease PerM
MHRGGIAVGVAAVLAVVISVSWDFVPVFVFAVFLYYSVRPIHRHLDRLQLPKRLRAGLSLALFGLPFVALVGYTAIVIIGEAQAFVSTLDSQQTLIDNVILNADLEFTKAEIHGLINEIRNEAGIGSGLLSLAGIISQVSSGFVSLLIVLILTYTMLVDGPRFKAWLVNIIDVDGVIDEYATQVDEELSAALFGNIVNVFVTAAIGVVVFTGYNFVAPSSLLIPFPGLLGALAGVGSLIPVIGIKLVYVPVTAWLLANSWMLEGWPGMSAIVGMFVLSVVVIDFIPDIFVRAFASGEATHTELLIVAYIVGASALGFYGLFLAPILLVAVLCAGQVLVPYIAFGEVPEYEQPTLESYAGDSEKPTVSVGEDVSDARLIGFGWVTNVLQHFKFK